MRAVLEWVFDLVLRIFFRRIEVTGSPPTGAAVYVLNHPNALIDPVLILCRAPQRVSFLAKEPIFRMPVLGWFARTLECLPVYRKRDGADPADNRRTLEAARDILIKGGAIALFPEGTSHSEPTLKPMKTGAARIALGAQAQSDTNVPVVPVGLTYTDKGTFRSAALLHFGEPLTVPTVELDASFEPPKEAVLELTFRIDEALHAVTVQSETIEALSLVERGQRIFTAAEVAEDGREHPSLGEQMELRRQIAAGYAQLRVQQPRRVAELISRVNRYESYLESLGLSPEHPTPRDFTFGRALGYTLRNLAAILVKAPLGLVGMIIHTPAYEIIRFLAFRFGRDNEDTVSTIKVLGAMLLFPLTWIGTAIGLRLWTGSPLAWLALLALPALAWLALVFKERLENFGSALRALGVFATRGRLLAHLARERRVIRDEIVALSELVAEH